VVNNRLTKTLLASFVSICLGSTCFGGVFASAALAASPNCQAQGYSTGSVFRETGSGHVVVVTSLPSRPGGYASSGVWEAGPVRLSVWQPGPWVKITPAPQPAPNPTTVPVVKPKPTPNPVISSGVNAEEQQEFNLLNADRAANGLPNLRLNTQLTSLAEYYAQDMINRSFFSHTNPEGQSPFDRMRLHGISYGYAGENLAINTSIPSAESAFMNSPGHRANILSAHYTQVGVGVRHGNNGSVYVVQEFTDG